MTTEEAIHARHSVRTYNPVMPDRFVLDYVNDYISDLKPVFPGTDCRLVLHDTPADGKIGTYGVVRGAQCYVAVVHRREGEFQAINAGMCGERLVLGLTGMGIGTIWLGGTFSGGDVSKQTVLCFGRLKKTQAFRRTLQNQSGFTIPQRARTDETRSVGTEQTGMACRGGRRNPAFLLCFRFPFRDARHGHRP